MTIDTKESLEQINEISRQLLSRIHSIRINMQPQNNNPSVKSPEKNLEELPSNKGLIELVSERQTLISHLFEQNTAEELSSEKALLQEMLDLDNELTTNSALSKQETAELVLKLKKSKKVKKSYQKY